jgi:hypothetical protein
MANVTTPNTDPPRLASRTRPRNHPLHAPGPLEKASINHHTENGFGKECSTSNKKSRDDDDDDGYVVKRRKNPADQVVP